MDSDTATAINHLTDIASGAGAHLFAVTVAKVQMEGVADMWIALGVGIPLFLLGVIAIVVGRVIFDEWEGTAIVLFTIGILLALICAISVPMTLYNSYFERNCSEAIAAERLIGHIHE